MQKINLNGIRAALQGLENRHNPEVDHDSIYWLIQTCEVLVISLEFVQDEVEKLSNEVEKLSKGEIK